MSHVNLAAYAEREFDADSFFTEGELVKAALGVTDTNTLLESAAGVLDLCEWRARISDLSRTPMLAMKNSAPLLVTAQDETEEFCGVRYPQRVEFERSDTADPGGFEWVHSEPSRVSWRFNS